ncbi:CLUMA_CG016201, isoform A [Clunio marinus]|uniref:CLUMA_CG016201, isoform A n=1 Tax=Clunio marinus TaxID=568069 RepID=A0A1J1IVD6_9DIPT|nr:CLUMA_CG016201, isoform A [Clunio marinus]
MTSTEARLIQWKKLYQLISGTFYNENQDVIKKKLLELSKEIEMGLYAFKKPTSDSNGRVEKLLKDKHQQKLIPFTKKLYQFLDLDVNQSYEILCYYLVNEYRGSASSLQNFVSSESLMIKLLSDIWFYYGLERMVLLKVTKCIVEFHDSNDHPYRDAFKAVIEKIGFKDLLVSHINQLEALINDIQHVKFLVGDYFNSPQKLQSWSERKHREMIEVLQIIGLCCHFEKIQPENVERLVNLFRNHSFGKQNQFLNPANSLHSDLIQKVTFNEVSCLMIILSTTNVESLTWMEEIINKLDETIIGMHNYPEHGPILISWMLFKFASKSNETTTDHFAVYGKLGSRAVQLGVFEFLYNMLQHKMFNDKSLLAKNIVRCLYDNLSFLCELFNTDGSISHHPKLFELFSEILKSPEIAKEFCKTEENPIRSIFNSALEKFPVELTPFSLIVTSLAGASNMSHKWILNYVQNLPVYTEQPIDPLYELRRAVDDEDEDAYILLNDYQPFKKINEFVIETGTKAIVREQKNRMFVHFFVNTNYFHVLHNEINDIMYSFQNFSAIHESQIKRLEVVLKFLSTIIKRIDGPDDITNEMIHPTEMVFDLLVKFMTFQSPPIDLMAICIDVCTELLSYFGDEITRRFINLKIAPSITSQNLDYKSYANGTGFESGLVGNYLINFERHSGRYSFLKAYLMIDPSLVELPGLIFLLREIFVHANGWHYENEQDRMDIFILVLEHVHDILTLPKDIIKSNQKKQLLRDICVYSLLNLEMSVALLKHVAVGNPILLSNFIENESNWFAATDSNLNLLVLNAMKILMQILKLKYSIDDENVVRLSPLEQFIYTQPKQLDTLKVIPIVTSYTSYPFNRRFSVFSCRLLRRFAIEFHSSLSACLDLEPDQIRMMFLQRLRDNLESDDLKIAVLDLVNACIDRQPGLTEAFFKVTYEQDNRNKFFIKRTKESENMCDGIVTYMEEYLDAIKRDPTKTTDEQLKRIMSLFHGLWKQGLQSLVKELVKKENFWSSLCSPLLTNPIESFQYAQLFNIIGIELFRIRDTSDEDEKFKKVLNEFLSRDVFKRWLDVLFDLPSMDYDDVSIVMSDTPEWLSRLQSFKDFIVLLLHKKSFVKIPNESYKLLLDMCLDALVDASERVESDLDSRQFVVLSEMFLILLNDQKVKYTKTSEEDAKLLQKVEMLMKTLTKCYHELHKRGKHSILAIAIKIIDLESDEIKTNGNLIALSFVRYNVEILCHEFFLIENRTNMTESEDVERTNSLILSINLLKKLLMLQENGEISGDWSQWFNHHKIFNRFLSALNVICQDYSQRLITAEIFDLLVTFAKGSPYSKELINSDLGDYLWMKLIPPKELIERNFDAVEVKDKTCEWTPQEWWIIYGKGIQLVKLLVEQHSHLFIKDALFFIGIHEEYLTDCIVLAKISLEPNAIKLIRVTLELLSEVVGFENAWRIDYYQSIMTLMKCVQSLMENSVSLLHRPKILKRLTETSKKQFEEYSDTLLTDPNDELVNSMNELIEIITLCAKCLLQFSPKLINLLCDVEFVNKWTPFIEVQFGAPKINSESIQQLSFATILSAIGVFVKALNLQHFVFKQIPINQIPNEQEVDGSETVSMATFNESMHQRALGLPPSSPISSPLSPRRPFSKSLSMTSASSSIVQASNELLSHLDSKICFAALEYVLTLLASQSLLLLKSQSVSSREKQLIRRELSNELYIFHDFVKKKIFKDFNKMLHRQKLGAFQVINKVDDDDDQDQPGPSRLSTSQRRSHDLRVNVVRKLHLQQKASLDIPTSFSPILHAGTSKHVPIDSPPLRSAGNPTTSTTMKRVGFDLSSTGSKVMMEEDDEPYVVNRADPSFTGLSHVKMVEEDYIHLLSNLFMFICQAEN